MRPKRWIVGIFAALGACGAPEEKVTSGIEQTLLTSDDPRYTWLVNFSDIAGHKGNNCSFPFNPLCSTTAHGDRFMCFERATSYNGYVKETIRSLHCPNVSACGGRPGDLDLTRICRQNSAFASTICGDAGGAGCAVCAVKVTCH
jgi:hypothetical protein